MSTTRAESGDPRAGASSKFVLQMRMLAALSALLALVALWSVERRDIRHDLQLAAEPNARPGEQLALRALLFRDVDATEGATLARAPTTVRLRDREGRELARTELVATPLDTLDGELRVPASITGEFTLEAESALDGQPLSCRRALHVAADARTAHLRGREAGPMQQFALGRVYPKSAAPIPEPWFVRVVGGACVPELRCQLLIWVGEPAAAITLRSGASAELLGPPAPVGETAGLVSVWLIVRGPDAEVTLQARRAGELVAERALRLPIGLGEVALHTRASIATPAQASFEYAPPPGRPYVLADFFVAGRWRASRILPSIDADQAFGRPELFPEGGLVRIQAHADRFGAESAGARVLYVRAPGESEVSALERVSALTAEELSLVGSEPVSSQALASFALADPQLAAAFLLAPLEALRQPVPRALSSRPAQLHKLERTRVLMRFGVAGALVVSALVIALSIAKRGLRATDEAEAILGAARGEGATSPPGERFRARARVVLLVLAVVSAFLAGALLIAAKPLWF